MTKFINNYTKKNTKNEICIRQTVPYLRSSLFSSCGFPGYSSVWVISSVQSSSILIPPQLHHPSLSLPSQSCLPQRDQLLMLEVLKGFLVCDNRVKTRPNLWRNFLGPTTEFRCQTSSLSCHVQAVISCQEQTAISFHG